MTLALLVTLKSGFLRQSLLSTHICPDALGRGKRGGGWDICCRRYMAMPTPSSLPSTQLNPHSSLPSSAIPKLYPRNTHLNLTVPIPVYICGSDFSLKLFPGWVRHLRERIGPKMYKMWLSKSNHSCYKGRNQPWITRKKT